MNPMESGLGVASFSRHPGPFDDLVAGLAQENETIEASTGGHFVGVLTVSILIYPFTLQRTRIQSCDLERLRRAFPAKKIWKCKCISDIRKGGSHEPDTSYCRLHYVHFGCG